jgi:hypothetical protein
MRLHNTQLHLGALAIQGMQTLLYVLQTIRGACRVVVSEDGRRRKLHALPGVLHTQDQLIVLLHCAHLDVPGLHLGL